MCHGDNFCVRLWLATALYSMHLNLPPFTSTSTLSSDTPSTEFMGNSKRVRNNPTPPNSSRTKKAKTTAVSAPLVSEVQVNPPSHPLPTGTVRPSNSALSLISSQPPNGVLPSGSSFPLTPLQRQRSVEPGSQREPIYDREELSTGEYPP